MALPASLSTLFTLQDTSQMRVLYYRTASNVVDIIPSVQSVEWEETRDTPMRSFTLTLDNFQNRLSWVREGGVVVIQIGPIPGKGWIEWFRGMVISLDRRQSQTEMTLSIQIQDPMRNLAKSTGNFHFPTGLRADQHILHLLRRLRFPIGDLEDTKIRLAGFDYSGTFADAINMLLDRTKKAGGARYVQEFADGKYWLVRYTEPGTVFSIGELITSVDQQRTVEDVVTKLILHTKEHYVVTVPGKPRKTSSTKSKTDTSGIPAAWLVSGAGSSGKASKPPKPHTVKKTRTVGQTVYAADEVISKYGIIQQVVEDNQIAPADLRQAVRTRLAKFVKPTDTLSVEDRKSTRLNSSH